MREVEITHVEFNSTLAFAKDSNKIDEKIIKEIGILINKIARSSNEKWVIKHNTTMIKVLNLMLDDKILATGDLSNSLENYLDENYDYEVYLLVSALDYFETKKSRKSRIKTLLKKKDRYESKLKEIAKTLDELDYEEE